MALPVKSCLDVVFWFLDQALNDKEYLQPQKLHRLLYLSQAYYAAGYAGRKLMPATFVTDAFGPVEPTVFHCLAYGRPHMIEANALSEAVRQFLESVWRRYGQYTSDQLTKRVLEHPPVAVAMAKGVVEEISFEEMAKFYLADAAARKSASGGRDPYVAPRVLRSQTGKPVAVSAWMPKPAGKDKKES